MNQVRVLFFATLRDLAGTKELMVEVESGTDVKELKAILSLQFLEFNIIIVIMFTPLPPPHFIRVFAKEMTVVSMEKKSLLR